jgi:membrane protein implicated in regulation of membrane protease activity
MIWWSWMIFGAVLLGAELFAIDAQFYLVFLGVSAALVGLAGLFGLAMPEWAQWLAFAILSLIFMFTFRQSLYKKLRAGAVGFGDSLSGDSIKITVNIDPDGEARIQHRGTEWTAKNVGNTEIQSGSNAKVVEVHGLTLHIRAD